MNFIIRPIRNTDAPQLNAIRRQAGVLPNTLGIPSERIERSERFVTNVSDWDHMFVAVSAEDDDLILGVAGLHIAPNPRLRHSGSIGLSVHENYQGKGIGKALMASIVDLADNWLMLKRLELGVLQGNDRALSLYKQFGFEVEGVKRASAIRKGEYVDETIMGRIRVDK